MARATVSKIVQTVTKNIPAELRSLPNWVCSATDGKPINPRTGKFAKSNDPNTWGTLEQAISGCERYGHTHVAFALEESAGICIVDLDDKPSSPASAETLDFFADALEKLDSYSERSRSGRGIHIVVKGEIAAPLKTAHVEIYDRNHFMTFTGEVIGKAKPIRERARDLASIVDALRPAKAAPNAMLPLGHSEMESDDAVIARASESEKFVSLHKGDWSGLAIGDGTQSAADLAYIGMLWDACGNAEQVTSIWLSSPLAQREKGQRPDYIARMLAKVTQSPPKYLFDDGPASLFSDKANAHRIRHHMGTDLLFVPGIGWHVWDGARWRCDALETRRHVGRLGRIVLEEAGAMLRHAAKIPDRAQSDRQQELAEKLLKHAGAVENVTKVEAALKMAEPLLRCDPDQLDADPWQLGCANGVLDLATGELRPPTPNQLRTKSTGIEYGPAAECPVWQATLQRIFRKHPQLPGFMQQLAGYWLTGLTDPPFLAVMYGVGANGKSTLVSALSHAMGDYAGSAAPGLLMSKYGQSHPTELAALQGMRFVVAAESSEGGRLDEEKIKALTGSDRITARRMREDFYTFNPTHKLAMMTNHKPSVRGVDEGIWRRVILIPFDEVIPAEERDPRLGDKLRAEAPGILRWAAEGARLFHRNGGRLELPPAIADATAEYRNESDVLGAFLSEECEEGKGKAFEVASALLYSRYESWCEEGGERPQSKRTLGLRLQDRGFQPSKDRRGQRTWAGLRLKSGRDAAAKAR